LLRFIEALEKMATEKAPGFYSTELLALIRALRHDPAATESHEETGPAM
jgi:hypothetical protein